MVDPVGHRALHGVTCRWAIQRTVHQAALRVGGGEPVTEEQGEDAARSAGVSTASAGMYPSPSSTRWPSSRAADSSAGRDPHGRSTGSGGVHPPSVLDAARPALRRRAPPVENSAAEAPRAAPCGRCRRFLRRRGRLLVAVACAAARLRLELLDGIRELTRHVVGTRLGLGVVPLPVGFLAGAQRLLDLAQVVIERTLACRAGRCGRPRPSGAGCR